MAIQYVGGVAAGRNGNANATTTQSLTGLTGGIASAPAEGDLVIVCCAIGSQGRNAAQAISGYSTLGTQLNTTAVTYDSSMQVSYKVMTSTPDTSITIPAQGNIADGQAWAVMVFRGIDTGTPFDTTSVSNTGTGTGRPDPAAITPTTAGAWIVIAGAAAAAATTTAFTAPTDFSTDFLQETGADTNDARASLGYYTGWTSGAYNPAQYTGGTTGANDSWTAWTMALRPASAATFEGSGSANLPLLTSSGTGKKTRSGSGTPSLPLATASGIAVDLPLYPEARRSLRYRWVETTGVYRKQWHPVAEPVLYQVTAQAATFEGSGTPSLPLATASGAAKRELKATGTPSLPLVTASGAGKKARSGTGSSTLPLVTATGAGSSQEDVYSGSGTPTLPVLTATGAGTKARKGTGTPSLPALTASGSAKRELKASGTPSLPLVTATGSGTSASDEITGSGTATLPLLTSSGAGKKERKGTGADTLPLLTASGAAKRSLKGSGAAILPFVTATGSGTKARKGTGATELPVLTASGAATRALKGSGTPSLSLLSASGDGQLEGSHAGNGDASLPLLTADGAGNVVRLATEERNAGGYGWENLARLSRRRRRQLEEEEADRLEALLIEEGTLPPNPAVLDRITVREYAPYAKDFSRRTQRAIDYALKARTDLAYQLAAREIARTVEEEELTMLLILAAA